MRPVFKNVLVIVLALFAANAVALKSDRDQPATVEADEVEYDFQTGVRTYKGNVIVEQGSLRITGDMLVVTYKGSDIEQATVWGRPATFKQRPEGKDQDVVGKGEKMLLDQNNETLTLFKNASLQQGVDMANGDEIVYDIAKEKLSIRGSAATKTEAGGQETATEEEPKKPTRAKVVITPQRSATE